MMDRKQQISQRLQTLADMVTEGLRIVDVGCDHGYLDISLVQSGKIPGALAMDVRKGPLSAATQHVQEAGLSDRIETRLSDGLEMFRVGEAQCLVCAGMGGPLMQKILTDYPEKTESLQEMILQPQSEIPAFRRFLREKGYIILQERILMEDGKYYFPMKVTRGVTEEKEPEMQLLSDMFGEQLIQQKEPLLRCYLLERERILKEILMSLGTAQEGTCERREVRKTEVMQELEQVERALAVTAE